MSAVAIARPRELTPGTQEFADAAKAHQRSERKRVEYLRRNFGGEYAARHRCACVYCFAVLPDAKDLDLWKPDSGGGDQ